MKSIGIAALVVLSAGCMQKANDGTYHVRAKIDPGTKQQMKKNVAEVKAGAKKIGKELERKSAEAAAKTGAALQHAAQKLKSDSEKRH